MEHTFVLGSTMAFEDPHGLLRDFKFELFSCSFDHSRQLFIFKCDAVYHDELSIAFTNFLRAASKKTTTDARLLGQLEMSTVTQSNRQNIRMNEQMLYRLVDEQDAQAQTSQNPTLSEPLIGHETVRETWSTRLTREDLQAAFSDRVLQHVGNATGCRLVCHEKNVEVIGDSEDVVKTTINKLTVLQEAHIANSHKLYYDFYIDEGESDYSFRFVWPNAIVDESLWWRERLSRACYEVVMVKWASQGRQYVAVPVETMPLSRPDAPIMVWTDEFEFEFGHETQRGEMAITSPFSKGSHEPSDADHQPEKNSQVARWRQLVSATPMNPFTYSNTSSQATHGSPEMISRTRRKILGQSTETQNKIEKTTASSSMPEIEPPMFGRKAPEIRGVPWVPQIAPLKLTLPRLQNPAVSRSILQMATLVDIVEQPFTGNTEDQIASGKDLSGRFAHASADVLQSKDEATSRKNRSGSALRSTLTRPLSKRSPELHANIFEAVKRLLDGSRARYDSKVVLEVTIGKILVKSSTVADEWVSRTRHAQVAFQPHLWSSIFRTLKNSGTASTKFSPRLTSSWEEAESIICFRSMENFELFTYSTAMCIVFEVHCKDDIDGEEVIIEISKNGKWSIRERYERVGSVNMHFPKRYWDASFVMRAARHGITETRARFQAVASNLWIRGPQGTSSLESPTVVSTTRTSVKVLSICLKRTSTHEANKALAHDVKAHLTLNQQLRIVEGQGGTFCAWLPPIEEVHSTDSQWWDMKLTSDVINKLLKDGNEALQVGELAKYEKSIPGTEVKDRIDNLLHMTKSLVSTMDLVGSQTLENRLKDQKAAQN